MSGSTISNTIPFGIVLGTVTSGGTYASPLTITSAGAVTLSNSGDAIYGPNTQAWTVINEGSVAATGTTGNGIDLKLGGSLDNSGLIEGYTGVHIAGAAGTIANSGTIDGTGTTAGGGIELKSGGAVTNGQGGVISGRRDGVYLAGSSATVSNSGTIRGIGPAYNDGIFAVAGGQAAIGNAESALISGYVGIILSGSVGAISNYGTVQGTIGIGVYLAAGGAGGSITNAQSGLISGVGGGVYLYGTSGTISNSGTIEATGYAQGVVLRAYAGASLVNAQSGLISGHTGVDLSGTAGTVVNSGRIVGIGTYSDGILLQGQVGAVVSNAQDGVISGDTGIFIPFTAAGSVSNLGTIQGNGVGVYLQAASAVINGTTNSTSGVISGGSSGIGISGAAGTVINYGTVVATTTYGVGINLNLGTDGTVSNRGMVIAGTNGKGIYLYSGNVTNYGTIIATGPLAEAVVVRYGTFFNSGLVAGAVSGIELSLNTGSAGSGTVNVAGTVVGATGISVAPTSTASQTVTVMGSVIGTSGTAVSLTTGGSDRLVVEPGAVFQGVVDGGGGASVLEVAGLPAAGAAAASRAGPVGAAGAVTSVSLGSVVDFSAAQIDPSATLDNAGVLSFDTLTNQGWINVLAGKSLALGVVASAANTGRIDLQGKGTVDFKGAVASQVVIFNPPGGMVMIERAEEFAATLSGFTAAGDILDLTQFDPVGAGVTLSGSELVVTSGTQSAMLQLDTSVSYAGVAWQTSADSTGGTDVTPMCFCRGTLILTDAGEVAVERLAIGDRVRTVSGVIKPVTWIGFGRDLVTRRNSLARPVIVRKGALADDVPRRDLSLTHGHALYIDGALIPVEHLVNHRSILWDERARVVEYYHIELADHDVVIAEGAPAESYYDAGNRALFHNARGGAAGRHRGAARPACAPVLTSGEAVERVWARLHERAGERAGGETAREVTADPDLHLVIAGARLDPVSVADGVYTFALAAPPAGSLHLCSRSAVPSLMGVNRHEHRRLGVALRQIILEGAGLMTVVDHAAPLLAEGGCHPPERGHSWTDGDFTLPAELFAHLKGAFVLIVHTRKLGMRYQLAQPLARQPQGITARAC